MEEMLAWSTKATVRVLITVTVRQLRPGTPIFQSYLTCMLHCDGRSWKVVSLFSGIGGLDLGLREAGHEIIMQCECDTVACSVLRSHFPGIKIEEDVCTISELPVETQILAAGFPCTDISRAGKQEGLEGKQSGLVEHVFRLVILSGVLHGFIQRWFVLEC